MVFKHIQNSIGVNFKPSYNAEATNTDQIEIVKINDELNSIHPAMQIKNPDIKRIEIIFSFLTPLSVVNGHDNLLNPSSSDQNVTDLSI